MSPRNGSATICKNRFSYDEAILILCRDFIKAYFYNTMGLCGY